MAVTSWSFSKLTDFATCKRMFWLKHDQRIPEPERILKPGQTEFANDRGTRVHESCEMYVNGTYDDLCPEAALHFGNHLALMRAMFTDGLVSLEGEWGMDRDWNIAPWNDAWLRLKLDALVHLSEDHAMVIDFKTGRKFGNEVKHMEQLQLYQLVTFLRYPMLEKVTAELWYLDQNETTSQTFTRKQGLRFKDNFSSRANKALSCIDFTPAANKFSCKWCPYKDTEHCEFGV